MAPMGDDVQKTCRWAALAGAEATDSELIDLPPSEQVARGKELLSMLSGFGEEPLSMLAAPQQSKQQVVPPECPSRSPPESGVSGGGSMPFREAVSVTSMAYHSSSTTATSVQPQVNAYGQLNSDWMMSQGQFASRPSMSPTSSPPVPQPSPMWGTSAGSGCCGAPHANSGSPPWTTTLSTNPAGWPMSTGTVQDSLVTNSAMHMNAVPVVSSYMVGQQQGAEAGSSNSYASWPAGAMGNSIAPQMMPVQGFATGTVAPRADQSNMFNHRNQMRAEAAPYVPGAMPLGVQAC